MRPLRFAWHFAPVVTLALGMRAFPARGDGSAHTGAQSHQVTPPAASELQPATLKALGKLPRGRGVVALQAALENGLNPTSAAIALTALGKIAQVAKQENMGAIVTLKDFTTHRLPAVRLAALRALGQAVGTKAQPRLSRGLGDSAKIVRDGCAEALLTLGSPLDAPRLALAMDQGSLPAAHAFGRWTATADLAQALKTRLQRLPLPVTLAAYSSALQRSDVGMNIKNGLLIQLRDQGTPAIRKHLSHLLQNAAIQDHPALSQLIRKTIKRIPTVLSSGKP